MRWQCCCDGDGRRCVRGGSVATFGPPTFRKEGDNRKTTDYYLAETEVTDVVGEHLGQHLTARISSSNKNADIDRAVRFLDPVIIVREGGGVDGGSVYLPGGADIGDYGTLLDKFEKPVE